MLATLSALEDRVADRAGAVVFAAVDAVEGWRADPWRAALAEQRKALGEKRERHFENASRLREIGWAERVDRGKSLTER